MLCRDQSLVNRHHDRLIARPLCCRSWTCDYCRPDRKKTVCREAAAGAPLIFVTLTVNPKWGRDKVHRAQELVKGWRKFVEIAKDCHSYETLPYFVVFEATKKGEPHLHILCRVPWISQRLLSAFMDYWMRAPIVYVTIVRNRRHAAWYVSKYMGKAPGKFGTCKRYWQSRNYQIPAEEDEYGGFHKLPPVERSSESVDGWIIWARRVGYPVVIHGDSCTVTLKRTTSPRAPP